MQGFGLFGRGEAGGQLTTEDLPKRQQANRVSEFGGEAGIRTLGTTLRSYNGLANRRLRPLGHLTADGKYT